MVLALFSVQRVYKGGEWVLKVRYRVYCRDDIREREEKGRVGCNGGRKYEEAQYHISHRSKHSDASEEAKPISSALSLSQVNACSTPRSATINDGSKNN